MQRIISTLYGWLRIETCFFDDCGRRDITTIQAMTGEGTPAEFPSFDENGEMRVCSLHADKMLNEIFVGHGFQWTETPNGTYLRGPGWVEPSSG